eukprot:scaffold97177_cov66-Phaeocystis_antarctica.AAC.2
MHTPIRGGRQPPSRPGAQIGCHHGASHRLPEPDCSYLRKGIRYAQDRFGIRVSEREAPGSSVFYFAPPPSFRAAHRRAAGKKARLSCRPPSSAPSTRSSRRYSACEG